LSRPRLRYRVGFVGRIWKLGGIWLAVSALLACASASALADDWLPHPAGAHWQYRWSDSAYNPAGTIENVIVQQTQGTSFTLGWADTADQPPSASSSSAGLICPSGADIGTMTFSDTNAGLLNTNWNSCPPPASEPILCATTTCPNSLASALYNVIWGNRAPVLSEPLLKGTSWNATGGAQNDVSSTSQYLGLQLVKVPAFPGGVLAAAVRTNIAQAGALGDPYGSGVRTTWWVYGVGPVRISFQHSGGSYAPVTNVDLLSTNQKPLADRPDDDYFPLRLGLKGTYRWTNRKHLRTPEVQKLAVAAVSNRTARITVNSVSGPIRENGQYGFSTRNDGVTNLYGSVQAASLLKLPKLGHNRHFFTVLDLATYGFNPLLPAYPVNGSSWHSGNAGDFSVYGVKGSTRILGVKRVKVPAGTFSALEVQSTLKQAGHRWGSGVRTMWFAAGRGLVKLEFKHSDGSVSLVQLLK
jgi:hypothetical protein